MSGEDDHRGAPRIDPLVPDSPHAEVRDRHDRTPTGAVGGIGASTSEHGPVGRHDDDVTPDAGIEAVEGTMDGGGTGGVTWGRVDWIICGGLVLLSLLFVGMHVRAYTTLSPIDELQHVDYMLKAGEFEVPHRGDRVGFEAMAEAACRSVDAEGYVGPLCDLDEYDPETFQERGINTAATQFPVYYFVTGIAARAMTGLGLLASSVTAGRLVGGLWLGAAWSVLWYVMAMLRIPRIQRAASLALFVATPLIVFHHATINADVALLFGGSIGLLATLKFEERRLNGWWLLLLYAALLVVEPTNLLIVGASAVYLCFRVTPRVDETLFRRLLPVAAIPTLALLRKEIVPWLHDTLYPARGSMSDAPMFSERVWDGISLDRILAQLPGTFTPIANGYLPPPLRTQLSIDIFQLVNWTLIGLLFAAAFVYVADRREATLSRVGMAALLAAGPLYTFYYAYFSEVHYNAPGRFGLPLVPFLVIAAAWAAKTRSAMSVMAVIAAISIVNTSYLLIT